MSLPREINYTHATAPDLVEDFVVAQVPLLIRHVHFSNQPFKILSGDFSSGFQSLTQKATHTNSSVESFSGATLIAFFRVFARTRDRVRQPIRNFHYSYSVAAARAAQRYRISS